MVFNRPRIATFRAFGFDLHWPYPAIRELDACRFEGGAQFDLVADEEVGRRPAILEGPCDQNQKPVASMR